MLEAGKYKVKSISDCFMGESPEKKTPYFCIGFDLENGQNLSWIVYLHNNFANDKAKEIAQKNMETIAKLGFKGSRLSDMAEGTVDDLFGKVDEEISIVVDVEEYDGKNGEKKTKNVVKFVNVGSSFTKIDKKQAVVALKSLPYDGWLVQSKKANPVKQETANKNQDGINSDEIPF